MKVTLKILTIILLFTSTTFTQTWYIKGNIKDALTNKGLSYVNIGIADTTLGTITNSKGEFELSIPHNRNEIIFSYIGYKTEVYQVENDDTSLTINLIPTNYLLQEVSVYAKYYDEISGASLSNKQIKQFSGISKDALRAVQQLPGVSANNEASANISVRGGSHDENLIIVNGVDVHEPYFLRFDNLVSLSIFNIDMVEKIDFSSGGFSAEYGDVLSSVLRVKYRSGNSERIQGKINLSLLDLGVILDGPLTDKGNFIVGFRKSYVDYLLKVTNANSNLSINYYDFQGRFEYIFTTTSKLSFDFIKTIDNAKFQPSISYSQHKDIFNYGGTILKGLVDNTNTNDGAMYKYYNDVYALTYKEQFNSNLFNETQLSFYKEKQDVNWNNHINITTSFFNKPNYFSNYKNDLSVLELRDIKNLVLRTKFNYLISPFSTLDWGFKLQKIFYKFDSDLNSIETLTSNAFNYPDTTEFTYPPNPNYNDTTHINFESYKLSTYLQENWQISNDILIQIGTRFEYFNINKSWILEPRLNLSYSVTDNLIARAAYGIFHQSPTFRQFKLNFPDKENTKNQRADHYILGIDLKLSKNISLKAEGFYKKYSSVIPVIRLAKGNLAYGKKENNAKGYAKGLDLQVKYDSEDFLIWISYGLLYAMEKTDESYYYPRYTDQRHTVSSSITADFGKEWNTTFRWVYGSGYAYTQSHLEFNSNFNTETWVADKNNSNHYPAYSRFDFRLSKIFSLFSGNVNIYLDILNVFGRRNVISYRYLLDENLNPKKKENKLFPMIPSLGLEYSF